MRATSERRTARNRGSAYVGDPGTPVQRRRRDYTGDGPSFTCDRCGAVVWAGHARHRVGGGQAKPWNVCGDLKVAKGTEALASMTAEEATARQLVTIDQIAKRFDVSRYSVETIRHWLPDPVGRLRAAYLFEAREVEAIVRRRRAGWLA